MLDGLFSDGVVLVESEGDRVVYQAAWDANELLQQMDLLFIPVNGKGAMPDIVRFFRTLRIPVAVIADLDLVRDIDVIPKLLKSISSDEKANNRLDGLSKQIKKDLSLIPPTLQPSDVKERLQKILGLEMDWSKMNDLEVLKELRKVANDLDRMTKLKKDGVGGYREEYPHLASSLDSAIEGFKKLGVFLVPCGELESWLSDECHENGPSRNKKQVWADHAATLIRQSPAQASNVIDFVKGVASYLSECKEQSITKDEIPSSNA